MGLFIINYCYLEWFSFTYYLHVVYYVGRSCLCCNLLYFVHYHFCFVYHWNYILYFCFCVFFFLQDHFWNLNYVNYLLNALFTWLHVFNCYFFALFVSSYSNCCLNFCFFILISYLIHVAVVTFGQSYLTDLVAFEIWILSYNFIQHMFCYFVDSFNVLDWGGGSYGSSFNNSLINFDRFGGNDGIDFNDVSFIGIFVILNNSNKGLFANFIVVSHNLVTLEVLNSGSLRYFILEDFKLLGKNNLTILEFFIPLDNGRIDMNRNGILSDDRIGNINSNLFLFNSHIFMCLMIDMTNNLNRFNAICHDQYLLLSLFIIFCLTTDYCIIFKFRFDVCYLEDCCFYVLRGLQHFNVICVLYCYSVFIYGFYCFYLFCYFFNRFHYIGFYLDHLYWTLSIELNSLYLHGFSLALFNYKFIFFGLTCLYYLYFVHLWNYYIFGFCLNFCDKFFYFRFVVFSFWDNCDLWLNWLDVFDFSFKSSEVNDCSFFCLFVFSDGDLLGCMSMSISKYNYILYWFWSFSCSKTFNMSFSSANMIFL